MEQIQWVVLWEQMLEGSTPVIPTIRITEDGTDRITEDDDIRITE